MRGVRQPPVARLRPRAHSRSSTWRRQHLWAWPAQAQDATSSASSTPALVLLVVAVAAAAMVAAGGWRVVTKHRHHRGVRSLVGGAESADAVDACRVQPARSSNETCQDDASSTTGTDPSQYLRHTVYG